MHFLGHTFASPDCKNELDLADKYAIPCIPLKTAEVTWDDLTTLKIARDFGKPYALDQFEIFCGDLYTYIIEFKRTIDLLDKEKRQIGFSKLYERVRILYKELEAKFEARINGLEERIHALENKKL